ncbi:MAG: DUF2232 domain-containing protein [Proteobacteria bacterium]|nr:DUF2232 domain-containing protein [Pseudomonadota bacterium]
MLQFGFIGLGSGAAAALLFASVTSGTALSIPLAYLAPLPIMIAALGWSHWAALIGALAGGFAIWLFFGGLFSIGFLAGIGLPGWWLGYLTMLARPAGNGSPTALEWYPPGRLVVWSAAMAAALVLLTIVSVGFGADEFRQALRAALREVFRIAATESGASGPATFRDPGRLIDVLVVALPPATAVMALITNTFNLWLAARIVRFSGRLTRPWPVLSEMTFPPFTAAALGAATALSFIDGMVGIVAGVVAASLLMAYGVLGFAVMHAVTRGMASRGFVLAGIYASVLIFGWPVLALCLVGLSETFFHFRVRAAVKRGPPAST